MSNIAVIGTTFGDESKARIVNFLSKSKEAKVDWIVRAQGGANAGHTYYHYGEKIVHNLLPSIDFFSGQAISERTKAFLGSGMVIDLEHLVTEIENDNKLFTSLYPSCGALTGGNRVYVDPDAFVVTQAHKDEDKAKNGHIGSTNRGIGPAYVNKTNRNGVRVRDYIRDNNPVIEKLKRLGVKFLGSLDLYDTFVKSNILFEGAQAVMLDLNHGTYPYVTCSDCTVNGFYSAGFNFIKIDKVYGVAKCYSTRVGEGPFPTELAGDEAESLRKAGNEWGATTGRPRRVGWLDLPMLKYACLKGGIDELVITKFDVLSSYSDIPVCINYSREDGKLFNPTCPADFFTPKPEYINMGGWGHIPKTNDFRSDSENSKYRVKDFISLIESKTGKKVKYITVGLDRDVIEIGEYGIWRI